LIQLSAFRRQAYTAFDCLIRDGTISGCAGSIFTDLLREETSVKNMILAAALVSASAFSGLAQTAPAPTSNGDTPAVATPDSMNATAPVEGANSFTEDQAKSRIEKAGFSDVENLMKDDKGVWMAAGMKDGKAVNIALDYQGNVVAK
jgi:hypothetical protein